MKRIQVGGHRYREDRKSALVDDVDYGRLVRHTWRLHNHGYAYRQVRTAGKVETILMHREVLRAPSGMEVDHVNGDPLDNRRTKLRLASHAENRRNNRPYANNTSGYKGVVFHRTLDLFQARIQISGKVISLGYYKKAEEAADAYDAAAAVHHGSFASPNARPAAKQLTLA